MLAVATKIIYIVDDFLGHISIKIDIKIYYNLSF